MTIAIFKYKYNDMVTQTLKDKVLKTVNDLQDDSILQGLLNYIEIENNENVSFDFDQSQLCEIEKAKQEVKNGLTKSHEEVNKEIDEWLEK